MAIYYDVFTDGNTEKAPQMGDYTNIVNGTTTYKTDVSNLKGTTICLNDTLATMTVGQLVYVSSVVAGKYSVKLADKSTLATSYVFGVVVKESLTGADVEIQTTGIIGDLDTSGKTIEQHVYLDTNGAYTYTKPTTGEIKIIGSVFVVDATGGAILIENIEVERGVFASLDASADTTITTAGTYENIAGTFSNTPIECFQLVADPAIQYIDSKTLYFEIDWHADLSIDRSSATANCGIKLNGVMVDSSIMATYMKFANETQTLSGTVVVELSENDKIQLVTTSDGNGDVLTFSNYTTTIKPFFNGG